MPRDVCPCAAQRGITAERWEKRAGENHAWQGCRRYAQNSIAGEIRVQNRPCGSSSCIDMRRVSPHTHVPFGPCQSSISSFLFRNAGRAAAKAPGSSGPRLFPARTRLLMLLARSPSPSSRRKRQGRSRVAAEASEARAPSARAKKKGHLGGRSRGQGTREGSRGRVSVLAPSPSCSRGTRPEPTSATRRRLVQEKRTDRVPSEGRSKCTWECMRVCVWLRVNPCICM